MYRHRVALPTGPNIRHQGVRTCRFGSVEDMALETSEVRGWWGGGGGSRMMSCFAPGIRGWAGHTGGKWRDSLKEENVAHSEEYQY